MTTALLNILPTTESSGLELARPRLPKWLKRPLPQAGMQFTSDVIADLKLETVCESAKCPNRPDCWSRRAATFMILGNICTRPCGFCSVPKGEPEHVADDEPARLAEAAFRLGLKHVVITSVTRDDLPDGGADHFARCIAAVRQRMLHSAVEVLTPDFEGNTAAIDTVIAARPPRRLDPVHRSARLRSCHAGPNKTRRASCRRCPES